MSIPRIFLLLAFRSCVTGASCALLMCAIAFAFWRAPSAVAAAVEQPASFSHRHHVSELGLDCRACHTTVDISAAAGMPSSATCTACHAQRAATAAANNSAHADTVHENERATSARSERLPEFVYFDHSVHGARGVACTACHGDIEHAPQTTQAALTTGWCADCHRHRERVASR